MALCLSPSSSLRADLATNRPDKTRSGLKPAHQPPSTLPPSKRRKLEHSNPSSDEPASASKWFDHVNKNVTRDTQDNSALEDPPFYLNRAIPRPVLTQDGADPALASGRLPLRDKNQNNDSSSSDENGDLRSVIDDLTIENKRLRQKLSQAHPRSALSRNKLFEVRTCGLSSDKKRELELILQRFAAGVGDGASPGCPSPPQTSAPRSTRPTTSSRPADPDLQPDSAYASLANSGVNSSRHTHRTGPGSSMPSDARRNPVVRTTSYLSEVPDNLLPKRTPTMSEQGKMRLVVRRLERLFTGKNAAAGEHSQPLQQQRVSESAAEADRQRLRRLNKYLRPEGAREASILPFGSNPDLEPLSAGPWSKETPLRGPADPDELTVRAASGRQTPDQRPTRPMDLDIHRAQVAKDNIDYIRHLGLPTPHVEPDDDQTGDDGWVYLNLLVNMAQLHTANVTPAFIKKSITTLSTKFELSPDGHKIRWTGGPALDAPSDCVSSDRDPTRGNSPHPTASSDARPSTGSPRGLDGPAGKTVSPDSGRVPRPQLSRNSGTTGTHPSAWDVTPRDESSSLDQPLRSRPFRHLSHLPCPLTAAHDTPEILIPEISKPAGDSPASDGLDKQADDGLLIYYRGCVFYCDVSPEKDPYARRTTPTSLPSTRVLGDSRSRSSSHSDSNDASPVSAEGFSGSNRAVEGEAPALDELPTLKLDPLAAHVEADSASVATFEASGIGGVRPEDHFQLRVRRRRRRCAAVNVAPHGSAGPMAEQVVSSLRDDLPPSELPPPSFLLQALSTQSSFQTDGDEDLSADQEDSAARSVEDDQPSAPSFVRRFLDNIPDEWPIPGQDEEECLSPGSAVLEAPQRAGGERRTSDSDDRRAASTRGHTPLEVSAASLHGVVGTDSVRSVVGSPGLVSSAA